MHVLDQIIEHREMIINRLDKVRIEWIKLYGSVLARKESEESDVDFFVSFRNHEQENHWQCYERKEIVIDLLYPILQRRISVQCSHHIFEKFRAGTERDAVDIRDLTRNVQYSISPKRSRLYYEMLQKIVSNWEKFYTNYHEIQNPYLQSYCQFQICQFLRRTSHFFSRMMRLDDNDLLSQTDLDVFGLIHMAHEYEESDLIDVRQRINGQNERDIETIQKYAKDMQTWLQKNNELDN